MAINKDIGGKITEMAASADLGPAPVFDPDATVQESAPMQMGLEFPEYEQEANLFGFFKRGAQAVEPTLTVKRSLKPLTEKGARLNQNARIVPDPPPVAPAPAVAQPKAAKPATKPSLAPVPLDEATRLSQERKALEAAGPVATTPETPISNLAFDNEGFDDGDACGDAEGAELKVGLDVIGAGHSPHDLIHLVLTVGQ